MTDAPNITLWVCPTCGDFGEADGPGFECEYCAEAEYQPIEYAPFASQQEPEAA